MVTTPADLSFEGEATRRRAPLPVAAAVAAVWAAALSYAPVLLLVALGSAGTGRATSEVVRLASTGWLLGHGVAVQTPADRITLMPLALTLLVVWRVARAGIHVSRATGAHRAGSVGPALVAGLAVGLAYGVLGAALALLAGSPDVTISVGGALLTLLAVGGGPAALAALAHSRAGRRLWRRTPEILVISLRGGVLAAALMLAVGAAAAGVALALRGSDAAAVLGGFHAGVVGQAGVTLACLAFAPNAVVWATAYLIGPGFAVGVGTVVSPGAVLVGPSPGVPLLAALPTGPVGRWGPVLLAAPLVAALAAGFLLARRREHLGWASLLCGGALGALVAGGLVTVAAAMSAGALGSGRLAEIGPHAWTVGAWAAGLAAVGLLVGSAAARVLSSRPT